MESKWINRIEFVKAMDMIARSVNDEEILEQWLTFGVADEDINEDTPDEYIADMYCEPDCMKSLLDTFLSVMTKARKSGGLFVDLEVCGGEK